MQRERKKDVASPKKLTADVFWSRVDMSVGPDACWPYTGKRDSDGYGQVRYAGRRPHASRVAYIFTHGAIPGELQVLHRCDNPPCCNPAHLFLGTNADNMTDKARKGRCNPRCTVGLLRGNPSTQFKPGHVAVGDRGVRTAAKLTTEQVLAARSRYAAGGVTERQLASEYGIGKSAMHDLLSGKNWHSVKAA